MSVTLTFDATLSRVRIDATGLNDALTALVERSTNQVTWTTVRGGLDVPVTAGVIPTVDDYEWSPDVINYYRVTYTAVMSFVAVGTVAHANNASVTPGLPAGHATGDVLLMVAAIRNSGAGTPNTPSGWSRLLDMSNFVLFGKVDGGAEVAPTVTFAGGVANADTTAQIAAFRGVQLTPVGTPAGQLNGSTQDIAAPGIANIGVTLNGGLNLWVGWKQDDWTSVAVVSGGTELGEPSTATGDDQGVVWDYRILAKTTPFSNLSVRTFTVTGGISAISRAGTVVFQHSLTNQTNSITPSLGGVAWIKVIARPFLNTAIEAFDTINITRKARHGVFDVVGRSLPVAVTDIRGSRQFDLHVVARTQDDRDRLDSVFASGLPIFLHVPPTWPIPSLYAVIEDIPDDRIVPGIHFFTLPIIQVAAPSADVVGSTNTWQTVINTYVSWTEEMIAQASWQDVLEGVAQPGDIEVL